MLLDRIDHVGVFVQDLDQAAASLDRLGFRMTKTSGVLTASDAPGNPRRSMGTRNRIAVLGPSFLEIVAVDDVAMEEAGPQPWRVRPPGDQTAGPCILGFGTSQIDAVDMAWSEAGVETSGMVEFAAEMAAVKSGVSVAEVVLVAQRQTPQGLVLVTQFPPGDRRSPEDCQHPNTAAGLAGVILAVADDDEQTPALYARLTGAPMEGSPLGRSFSVGPAERHMRLIMMSPAQVEETLGVPEAAVTTPSMAGVLIEVRSLTELRDRLAGNRVDHRHVGDQLLVRDATCNVTLVFEERSL